MAGKTQTSGPRGGQGELGEETEVDAHPWDTAEEQLLALALRGHSDLGQRLQQSSWAAG